MKIYKTQSEVEAVIKDGVLDCYYEDVRFECDINIKADIINAYNINAHDINAHNIIAHNINAYNINAYYITAYDIKACDINAYNITACDINASNIIANDISYYAFCSAYNSIKCKSIKGRRYNAHAPICLDGKLEIIPDKDIEIENAIKLLESKGLLKDGKILNK